ncbi:MAG: hypothetical protein ACOX5J_09050 [Candidatus Hydrogenedentales bacterium]
MRQAVRRIIDHLLDHGYNLVDHDGQPTRWGHFSPEDLNRNEAWCAERGLNSFSILTYLSIAHHITGKPKYRKAYRELALEHGYGMNGMTQPGYLSGPGCVGHQPDDNMAFMNYYHLIRYETDPKLLSMYQFAIMTTGSMRNANETRSQTSSMAHAASAKPEPASGVRWILHRKKHCFDDAIDTLKRYPLDLVDWPMSNAHRIDIAPILDETGLPSGRGGNYEGQVFPIDERHETYWDLDPWALSYDGDGTRLREGVPYLLAYYMARVHGFLDE